MAEVAKARVISVDQHGDNIRKYILKVDELNSFEAGQFLQLTLDDFNGSGNWPESRAFSIASYLNDDNTLTLVIKKVGPYTGRIFSELRLDSYCTIKYPYGEFMLPMFDDQTPIHCIAGGTGISPFLSFIGQLQLQNNTNRMFLHYSSKQECDFVNLDLIFVSLPSSNVRLYCTKEESKQMTHRRVTIEDVIANVKDIEKEYFYLCGSIELITFMGKELMKIGAKNIIFEEWT
jgi:ferredoxin-NADP reductase